MDVPAAIQEIRNQLGIQTDFTQLLLAFALFLARVLPVFTHRAIASSQPVVSPIPFAIPSIVARCPHPQWHMRQRGLGSGIE